MVFEERWSPIIVGRSLVDLLVMPRNSSRGSSRQVAAPAENWRVDNFSAGFVLIKMSL